MIGRRKPYTAIGISRVPCCRCGAPSHASWQVCANGNRYVGICQNCDIELNRMVLRFMRLPGRGALMATYVREAG